MQKFTLYGAGTMMLLVGLLHLLAPQMMMQAPAIELSSVNHLHIIRAAYGGAYLGIAALFLLGTFKTDLRQASLIAVALLFAGFAVGRIVSILLDGIPVPLYLAVLAFEVVFASLAVVSLRQTARA